jgi:hypothetical protein
MMEYGGLALSGLIVFGIGMLRLSPTRPGERSAEILLAIISALCLLSGVFGATDGATGRLAAAWTGAVCGYLIYRLLPKRAPEPPRMSAQYHAATRRIDEAFEALKVDAAGDAPDQLARAKVHFHQIDKGFQELAREGERMRSRSRQTTLAGAVIMLLFLVYLVVQYARA